MSFKSKLCNIWIWAVTGIPIVDSEYRFYPQLKGDRFIDLYNGCHLVAKIFVYVLVEEWEVLYSMKRNNEEHMTPNSFLWQFIMWWPQWTPKAEIIHSYWHKCTLSGIIHSYWHKCTLSGINHSYWHKFTLSGIINIY